MENNTNEMEKHLKQKRNNSMKTLMEGKMFLKKP
jgi:hypothetical protein